MHTRRTCRFAANSSSTSVMEAPRFGSASGWFQDALAVDPPPLVWWVEALLDASAGSCCRASAKSPCCLRASSCSESPDASTALARESLALSFELPPLDDRPTGSAEAVPQAVARPCLPAIPPAGGPRRRRCSFPRSLCFKGEQLLEERVF